MNKTKQAVRRGALLLVTTCKGVNSNQGYRIKKTFRDKFHECDYTILEKMEEKQR